MKFIAEIDIRLHKELPHLQGKTVSNNMKNVDIEGIEDVCIDKHITMKLKADSEDQANEKADTACKKLPANMIMETDSFSLKSIDK